MRCPKCGSETFPVYPKTVDAPQHRCMGCRMIFDGSVLVGVERPVEHCRECGRAIGYRRSSIESFMSAALYRAVHEELPDACPQ